MKLLSILSSVACLASVALSAPAPEKRAPDARVDAGGDWVKGSAEWDWKTAHTLKNVKFGLSDYDCNHDVYIELLGYTKTSGSDYDKVAKRSITSGCNGKHQSWNLGEVSGNDAYPRWGIRVCRSDAGKDTCYSSGKKKNPKY